MLVLISYFISIVVRNFFREELSSRLAVDYLFSIPAQHIFLIYCTVLNPGFSELILLTVFLSMELHYMVAASCLRGCQKVSEASLLHSGKPGKLLFLGLECRMSVRCLPDPIAQCYGMFTLKREICVYAEFIFEGGSKLLGSNTNIDKIESCSES
ncbi:hypothetical protein OUZ56_020930 [Daphnia magna]|uniref:Uncharacterized protein n=1 Tax=Daphnia magna TaxID=35525 RepID=A0ABQ9ZFV3_9CRUS|nr:hypothetical protein OUZ56_020930 [Daphnia magna]